jgi:HAD superfamily hydrolase (TIGR01509 family)
MASRDVSDVKLLLFDLGGVLVDFAGPRELGRFLRTPASPAEILDRWIFCPHTRDFERGRISPREWAERFVRDWDIHLEPEKFLLEFKTWSNCILPGTRELLASLRPLYRLAALSNANEVHWERNANELKVLDLFEFAISSHQVGLCKPDPEIFKVAINRARVAPAQVMFFDDLAVNVAAAASLGIRAREVRGVEGVRACLAREGLLARSLEPGA